MGVRLTWKRKDGSWGLHGVDVASLNNTLYGVAAKLKDYEETGLAPDQIRNMDELYLEKCEEVNRLKSEIQRLRGDGACGNKLG